MARGSTGFWTYRRGAGGPTPQPAPFTLARAPLVSFGRAVVRVADDAGQVIGQLFGTLESVTWRADGYGMVTLLLAPEARITRRNLLAFGNRLRIDFDNGLPPWVGMIDVPQELAGGMLRVVAYEPAYLLSLRLTRRMAQFPVERRRTAVDVARLLVLHLEGRAMSVDSYGTTGVPAALPVEVSFSFEKVLGALDRLRELDPHFHYRSGADFDAGPGRIEFGLLLYRGWVGADEQMAILQQGINLADVRIIDQGPIVNRVVVASGDANVEGDAEQQDNEQPTRPPWRPNARYNPVYYPHAEPGMLLSAALAGIAPRYGRREEFVVLSDVSGEDEREPGGQMESYAATYLDTYGIPSRRVSGVALNLSLGAWRLIDVGRRVRLRAFDDAGRTVEQVLQVAGMDYVPAVGTLVLVLAGLAGEDERWV